MTKLTKAIIDAAEPRDKEYLVNEGESPGFALRVFTTGRKSFVYHYRVGRRSRKLTLGNAEVIPLALARQLAVQAAGKVAAGLDPAAEQKAKRDAITVRELAERFDATHITFNIKGSTGREYRRALKLYILPALGSKKVEDVTRVDVTKLFHSMIAKPTQANRTLEIVSKMFNLSEEWGLRPIGSNPRKGIRKNRELRRERFLSSTELARLGKVLSEVEAEGIEMRSAIAAVRLLVFTGCRRNEIVQLAWSHVDLNAGVLRLPDSKTGRKVVALSNAALAVLTGIDRASSNPWVIAGKKEDTHLTDLEPFWQRIRERAGIVGVRLHDLRHTFASVAASSGMSLQMIGQLLGHQSLESTRRYAHLAHGTVKDAADRVANAISLDFEVRDLAPPS